MANPVSRRGDIAYCPSDAHNCALCAHPVLGPAVEGSPDFLIDGQPVLRLGDRGRHMLCCGSNEWLVSEGSSSVFVNGRPVARQGDETQHCGGVGSLITGSGTVQVGGGSVKLGQTIWALRSAAEAVERITGGLFNPCALPDGLSDPPGVDVQANMSSVVPADLPWWLDPLEAAMNSPTFANWVNKVREGGDWDFKTQGAQYENFGNFHYGATGTALGIPASVLKRSAGLVQRIQGTPGYDMPWGDPPYGDDWHDQDWIQQGIDYANKCRVR